MEFDKLLGVNSPPMIQLDHLRSLQLHSCPDLGIALLRRGREQQNYKYYPPLGLQLIELSIRHENTSPKFESILQDFLCSLGGLQTLHVLLQGSFSSHYLDPILAVHGTSLRSLVWDERQGPRLKLDVGTMALYDSTRRGHLRTISRNCPKLRALGIALDWSILIDLELSEKAKVHSTQRKVLLKLSMLALIRSRNLFKECLIWKSCTYVQRQS